MKPFPKTKINKKHRICRLEMKDKKNKLKKNSLMLINFEI